MKQLTERARPARAPQPEWRCMWLIRICAWVLLSNGISIGSGRGMPRGHLRTSSYNTRSFHWSSPSKTIGMPEQPAGATPIGPPGTSAPSLRGAVASPHVTMGGEDIANSGSCAAKQQCSAHDWKCNRFLLFSLGKVHGNEQTTPLCQQCDRPWGRFRKNRLLAKTKRQPQRSLHTDFAY